ncbi:hypothetical protein M0R45_015948 [Rubus argutus]|uniref:Bifunctional inhibitor/plant lipid transfer protein/seed storage helical domain-containing protein n=1 Tax=Rubus argutus TaxID=59490 RepID=A0AAW1XR61_RUBAR
MASSGVLKVVCVVVVFMAALLLGGAKASLQCHQYADDLLPCIPYVQINSGVPAEMCCNGIRTVYTKNQITRIDIARCILKLKGEESLGDYHFALGLPDRCGVVG